MNSWSGFANWSATDWPDPGGKSASPGPPRQRRVLADLHVHASLREWLKHTPVAVRHPALPGLADLLLNPTRADWRACHEAGIDAMCVAHFNPFDEWLSMPTDPSADAPDHTRRMLDLLEEELAGRAAPFARLARNRAELAEVLAVRAGDPRFRVAVVHTLEGAHALGGSLESLPALAARGVAAITLTHFFDKGVASAANAFPFFPDADSRPPGQGLSGFGHELLAAMEDLGIVADVTHLTDRALDDVLAVARRPLLASHASARTLADRPYAIHDDQILEIVRRGGLFGVILDPYLLSNYVELPAARALGSLDDVVRTVRYVAKLCGTTDGIGIGSDFSGYVVGPRDLPRLSRVSRLREALLEEFEGDEDVVEGILAGNALRFLAENWRSGA